MIREQKFLEFKQVHENFYGSGVEELFRINNKGKVALFEIDIKGAMDLSKHKDLFTCNPMFILPPSQEELRKRLKGRKSESEADVELRLKSAQEEIDKAKNSGLYGEKDYLINSDWKQASEDFIERIRELYSLPQVNINGD